MGFCRFCHLHVHRRRHGRRPNLLLRASLRPEEPVRLRDGYGRDRLAHCHGVQGARRRAQADDGRRQPGDQLVVVAPAGDCGDMYRHTDDLPE